MRPLITIGITCFNAAGTVSRAILSAVGQDWPNKEIVVVDDCSTDESWKISATLAERHHLKLIRHKKNTGVAAARNTLLEAARGEFIAYFDDDDESYPQRLSQQWKRIVEYERAYQCGDVLCTAVREIAINGKIDHRSTALGQNPPEPSGTMVADYLLGISARQGVAAGLFGTCVLMARVSVLRELGGFDPEFRRCAEWDMAIRAAFNGAHFVAVNEPLVIQHKTRGEEKSGDIPLRYSLKIREKHEKYLRHLGLYRASRAIARANFHGNKGRYWTSHLYTFLACVLSPIVLRATFSRRFKGWT